MGPFQFAAIWAFYRTRAAQGMMATPHIPPGGRGFLFRYGHIKLLKTEGSTKGCLSPGFLAKFWYSCKRNERGNVH